LLASATETYEVDLRLLLAGEERPDTPASGEIAHSSTLGRSAQAAKRARQKANRARKQAEYEGPPARLKPSFGRLPRSKSMEEATTPDAEGAVAFLSTEGDTEVEGADGVMSEADASKRIAEDLKELFDIRNVDEGEDYFEKLPAAHHARLVEKVISRAIESKEADAQLAADLFARAVEKELCTPDAFERGFLPIAELLDDIVIDAPKAFNLMALMLKGAGLADDEERCGRIAEKSIDADKLIALLFDVSR
jgi:translation initiation factor 4G